MASWQRRLGPGLAGSHQLLFLALDALESFEVVGGSGGCRLDLGGHVGELDRQGGPHGLAGQLVFASGGEETLSNEVVVRRGVLLEDREHAVVVGEHQPIGRNETRRAAVELHRCLEQPTTLRLPEIAGGKLQTQSLEMGGIELQHLGRRPFAGLGTDRLRHGEAG